MLAVLGILVLGAALLAWRPWARRGCDWQLDARKLADGRALWSCTTCGASEAGPRPPSGCLRGAV